MSVQQQTMIEVILAKRIGRPVGQDRPADWRGSENNYGRPALKNDKSKVNVLDVLAIAIPEASAEPVFEKLLRCT